MRARRSCLSVPGSRDRFLEKADGLPADEVIFDLEDSVAPAAKAAARGSVVGALRGFAYEGKVRAVRVNDFSTAWHVADVTELIEGAGDRIDSFVVPKVEHPQQVQQLDALLQRLGSSAGLELQIESARGLENVSAIAAAASRTEALIFGPLDLSADLRLPGLDPGAAPPGFWHPFQVRILTAARANGLQVIDGPWFRIQDPEGLRASAGSAAALGYDGKWALNPVQIDVLNEVFSPRQADVDKANAIVQAYRRATQELGTGALLLGDEMIDEASRKLAMVTLERAAAFGIEPGPWRP